MFYTDASGNVRLSICEEGCGHLAIGNMAVSLTQEEMCDLLYVFRNAIDEIADPPDPLETAGSSESCSPAHGGGRPVLMLVRD